MIIAYSPCINHGIRSMGTSIMQGSGRSKRVTGISTDTIRSCGIRARIPLSWIPREPTASFRDFLMSEVRYSSYRGIPDIAEELFAKAEADARERLAEYQRLAAH